MTEAPSQAVAAGRYPVGVAMVLMAGLCLSLGGLILRHIESASVWQVSFYRSLALVLTLLCFLLIRYRGRVVEPFRQIGGSGAVVMICMGLGSISYIVALSLTTVANTMFILSAAPLMTAALGWLVLGERVHPISLAAMVLALCGIALMVVDGLQGGHLDGNLVALFTALAFAVMLIAIRRARNRDMVPASCLGGALAALISLPLAGELTLSRYDLSLAIMLGTFQVGAGFLLITLATRWVPAAEVSLLALSEVILAPIWVWIFINEVPSRLAMIGGTVVLVAVIGQAVLRIRLERRTR